MEHLLALVLAAGEGKRMKSKNSKVTHRICGRALIGWVSEAARNAGIDDCVYIVGHRSDQVMECLGKAQKYVLQEQQLGTGHAVMQARDHLTGKNGYAVVLYGDMPLIRPETISELIEAHRKGGNSATVITAEMEDPTGYGRIVRNAAGDVVKNVEERDASAVEKAIREINTGIYCFTIKDLLDSLKELKNENSQGEYYLTDTLEILVKKGLKVGTIKVADSDEIRGINDRVQLYEASEALRKRILEGYMRSGVTIIDPGSTYIDHGVEIGIDTVIYPGTMIEEGTVIGEDCRIGPGSRIAGSTVGSGVEIMNSVVLESTIGDNTRVGPFAYVRPNTRIGRNVRVGDFVEIKNSVIGDRSKVSHLTYVGDSDVGGNVNFGCGVVTVNYNGKKKYRTVIGDDAFIGCNVNLIAPVEVGRNAYVAAGSTITDDVPEDSLAIARQRQANKEGWVTRKGMGRSTDSDKK